MTKKIDVAIIMGSDSDLPTMTQAAQLLDEFKVDYEILIVSAHRTPEYMFEFAKKAEGRGIKVIIAGAGGAAHLPGMTASLTNLPVIGVPIKTSSLSGVDSLYSIVQMPAGIPVACVAIGNAINAALLAIKIISIYDKRLNKKLQQFMKKQTNRVLNKSKKLKVIGYKKFLKIK